MKPRILVVDDSAFALRRVRAILEGAGYQVLEAEDGLTALQIYTSSKPDLVLLDLVMSGMYGFEVLARLRELDRTAKVVVLSADIQTPSRELVDAGGAAGFLVKPVDPGLLLELVESLTGSP